MPTEQQPIEPHKVSSPQFSDALIAQMMLQHTSVIVVLLDLAGQIQYVSPSLQPILGMQPSLLVHTAWLTLAHSDDQARLQTALQGLNDDHQAVVRFRQRHANGTWRWLEASIQRVSWEGQHYLLAQASDVTAHHQLEQQRRALLDEANAVLASSLDYERTIALVISAVANHLGGWCAVEVAHPEGQPYILAVGHYLADQQEPLRTHLEAVVQSEHTKWLLNIRTTSTLDLQQTATIAASGESITVIGAPLALRNQLRGAMLIARTTAFNDDDLQLASSLANQIALAIDHAQMYSDAQTAINVRDHFMSIASHELKTPLTSMYGNLQLLQRRLHRQANISERDLRTLRTTIEQSQRINRLISALLDGSRIQSGRMTIERQKLNLVALVRRIVEESQPALEKHTIFFRTSDEQLSIAGDPMRLEQVFENLLQNAAKYSPGGGPIELSIRRVVHDAIVEVHDQGIGIPPESIPYLFDRFYRAPNVESQHISGIGIGLFVVREIVSLHGGEVNAASSGSGSQFTVRLPLLETSP